MAQTLPVAAPEPGPEELIARARALVPRLRERVDRCEQERRVPEESIRELKEAGLFRVLQPRAFGGVLRDVGLLQGRDRILFLLLVSGEDGVKRLSRLRLLIGDLVDSAHQIAGVESVVWVVERGELCQRPSGDEVILHLE